MANGWNLERRARQAELIRAWKPWNRSTGPKTKMGKMTSATNARTHGMRSAEMIAFQKNFNATLRKIRKQTREMFV